MTSSRRPSARLFTSESVTEGHPDKVCDRISDAVLDAILAQDPSARVAVETMATPGLVHVAGEVTTTARVEIPRIVHEEIAAIGYTSPEVGFAAETGDDAGDVLAHGAAKARRKGADLMAVNAVGPATGFGDVPNSVVVLDADGAEVARAAGSKDEVARALIALIARRLGR